MQAHTSMSNTVQNFCRQPENKKLGRGSTFIPRLALIQELEAHRDELGKNKQNLLNRLIREHKEEQDRAQMRLRERQQEHIKNLERDHSQVVLGYQA